MASTLTVPLGAVVQFNLVNGDGATHDLTVSDFGAKSNQVNGEGASTLPCR
jgi:nitrite reductase (NO-forming)